MVKSAAIPGPFRRVLKIIGFVLLSLFAFNASAHGVDQATEQFLAAHSGVAIVPFLYIGAKHMVTGYDHLLFLTAVIFFLFRIRDVLVYVSLFTLGHSITLLTATLNHTAVNPYLIDAIIGASVVYKGFDNLGAFKRILGAQPNTKIAVFIFGLFHGFGLATKLQDFHLPGEGLVRNLLAFNVGVEIGQSLALFFILLVIGYWRAHERFYHFSTAINTLLISSGFLLVGYQLTAYFILS